MFLYHAALKQVATKIDILNDEFQYIQHYNPIETRKIENQNYRKQL